MCIYVSVYSVYIYREHIHRSCECLRIDFFLCVAVAGPWPWPGVECLGHARGCNFLCKWDKWDLSSYLPFSHHEIL